MIRQRSHSEKDPKCKFHQGLSCLCLSHQRTCNPFISSKPYPSHSPPGCWGALLPGAQLLGLHPCSGIHSRASRGASERRGILWRWRGPSGLRWVWRNGRGPHLEGRQAPQASSAFRTPTAGSLQSWDRRVRPRLEGKQRTLLSSRVGRVCLGAH